MDGWVEGWKLRLPLSGRRTRPPTIYLRSPLPPLHRSVNLNGRLGRSVGRPGRPAEEGEGGQDIFRSGLICAAELGA